MSATVCAATSEDVPAISGEALGYASSTSFRPRPAYARTTETSIYL